MSEGSLDDFLSVINLMNGEKESGPVTLGAEHAASPEKMALIFKGAAEQHRVLVVKGSMFEAGKRYRFSNGILVILGDVPDNVYIEALDAKVFIRGDVGRNANIHAKKPERHIDTFTSGPIFAGMKYPDDKDCAIIVVGAARQGATLTSNDGIHNGKPSPGASFVTSWGICGNLSSLFIGPVIRSILRPQEKPLRPRP